jgi:hypothetical protein
MRSLKFRNIAEVQPIWISDSHILEMEQEDVFSLFNDFSGSDLLEINSPITGNLVVMEPDEVRHNQEDLTDQSFVVIYRPTEVSENFELHLSCH